MDITRHVAVRLAGVGVLALVAALALAVWRARVDVQREERGAAEMTRVFEQLRAIESGRARLDDAISVLRAIERGGALRHASLELRDAQASVLVAPLERVPGGWLEHLFARITPGVGSEGAAPVRMDLRDPAGNTYVATLRLDPASERDEALSNGLGMLVLLGLFAASALLAVYAVLRRALAPLRTLHAAIARFEVDDLAHRVPALGFRELDAIGGALNHFASTLEGARRERRMLSMKLVSSQDDERARLARELHDEFGQTLTAMRADIAWLERAGERSDRAPVLAGLAAHCTQLQSGVGDLLKRLRSSHAGDVALRELLDGLVDGWNVRLRGATRFEASLDPALDTLDPRVSGTLYRLTQEAFTNAVRHANAGRVQLSVRREHGAWTWAVADDGVGIDGLADAMRRGNGLAGMRERVWAAGGRFDADARGDDGRGLRLSAIFEDRAIAPERA